MDTLPLGRVLERIPNCRRNGSGWIARCPAHDDKQPSLSISEAEDRRVLMHCHAGCSVEQVLSKLGLNAHDLFPKNGSERRERDSTLPETDATTQPSDAGCSLEQYAKSKRLSVEFLRRLGLKEIYYEGRKTLRIPYFNEQGEEGPVRFRLRIEKTDDGDDRFRWRKGSKITLYGRWRFDAARKAGYAVRVEGESDCHTAWFHGIPAFGIPGASNWREEWADYFEGIPIIYDVIEPDKGGETWLNNLSTSRLRDRVRLVRFDDVKDLSELHCADPDAFLNRWQAAKEKAIPFTELAQTENRAQAEDAWQQCESLAKQPSILERFAEVLKSCSVAGEARTAKIIYLAMVSRFLERPVSIAVKGPSSGGKSYITERVLSFFPESAYYALSAMSERALAYSEEPLSHKFLVIYEAAALHSDFASYLLRSLLSEGRVRYETVEKTSNGMRPRLIEREGPTGLIVTTTSISLHSENETRMLSLTVLDTPEQTRDILLTLANEKARKPDLSPWHALQTWIERAEHRVTIPFSRALAERIPPVATRLRRDFTAILNLIRAHALLHQAQRKRDTEGRIVATLEDYEVVRELVADLLSEGLGATISKVLRETIKAVQELTESNETTNYMAVARKLGLDKATSLRRVRAAIEKGYVRNLEDRKGREARLVIGESLPEDVQVLPTVKDLQGCTGLQGCGEDATAQAEWNEQDKYEGCRVAENNEDHMPSPPPTMICEDCGDEIVPAAALINELKPLCAGCAASRVVFEEEVI